MKLNEKKEQEGNSFAFPSFPLIVPMTAWPTNISLKCPSNSIFVFRCVNKIAFSVERRSGSFCWDKGMCQCQWHSLISILIHRMPPPRATIPHFRPFPFFFLKNFVNIPPLQHFLFYFAQNGECGRRTIVFRHNGYENSQKAKYLPFQNNFSWPKHSINLR